MLCDILLVVLYACWFGVCSHQHDHGRWILFRLPWCICCSFVVGMCVSATACKSFMLVLVECVASWLVDLQGCCFG